VYIPYLESLIASLETRFADDNRRLYYLFNLHPQRMLRVDKKMFLMRAADVEQMYSIDNFVEEAGLWYDVWANRVQEKSGNESAIDWQKMSLIDLLDHSSLFPAVRKGLSIALATPATTCTVERSFSTMRRVKTWLRSTMSDDRLSGLCMMSVHRGTIWNSKTFISRVIDRFGQNPRRLQLLFRD